MRRKLVFGVVALTALATAGVAAAANGGFTPETPHSPNAHKTVTAYYVVLGFTAAIFLAVEGSLVYFIWRYRGGKRARTDEGPQLHGHSRLELGWTVVPVVILAIIGTVIFIELPGISSAPASTNPIRISVVGHQFYWEFQYPNGTRTINELHVPVDQVVDLTVKSGDVVHSWYIPQLGGKIQAIPGRTNHTWFQADSTGTYYGQCAEFCGVFHEAMAARVVVTSSADYTAYTSKTATANLGKAEFTGVCATCHGMQGNGGYGPAISSNSQIVDPNTLTPLLRNGNKLMPPVGDTWTAAQIKSLTDYTKAHIYKGASTSGG
ncbi:MAG TPA: cytochrome c oxidase subunit II [Gaiellaceae bacterium]